MILSSRHFFLLYDYHQTAEISFIWRAVLRRQIDAFKNFVTRRGGGRGTSYSALHRGLRPKGVPFSGFRHSLASISYLKDSAFTTVKGMQRLLGIRYVKGLSFPSSGYLFCQKWCIKAGKGLDHGADPPVYKTLLSSHHPPPPPPTSPPLGLCTWVV